MYTGHRPISCPTSEEYPWCEACVRVFIYVLQRKIINRNNYEPAKVYIWPTCRAYRLERKKNVQLHIELEIVARQERHYQLRVHDAFYECLKYIARFFKPSRII